MEPDLDHCELCGIKRVFNPLQGYGTKPSN